MDGAYEVAIGDHLYLVSWGRRRVANPSGRDSRWVRYCEIQQWCIHPEWWDGGAWAQYFSCDPALIGLLHEALPRQ